jgi:hypothetical protein
MITADKVTIARAAYNRHRRSLPMSTPAKKLKNEPASRKGGATTNSLVQTMPMPAQVPKRDLSDGPKTETPTPRSRDKSSATCPDHPNEADDWARISEMLGTTDPDFAKGIYQQLISASYRGNDRYDAVELFFSLAAIKGRKPKDRFQAMLAVQATVTHVLTMKHAAQLARADCLPIQDSAERAYNKLARTFVMQVEALNRLETGGEHNVTVQNVSVSEGGQAIVGNVNQSAREKLAETTRALTDARQPAMPIIGTSAFSTVPINVSHDNDEPPSP